MSWTRVASFALIVAGVGCGGGSSPVHLAPDGGDARRTAEVGGGDSREAGDVSAEATAEAPADVDAALEAGPEGPARDAPDAADAAVDASDDASADAGMPEAPADRPAEAAPEAPADVSVEKPPATASWTIAPNPMCTAAGAGCMDTGAVGGYQVTASGSCPGPSSVQLWFPGGAPVLAAGSYAVKPAAGILDVISMPAGMVGVLAERTDTAAHRHWGRAGTVTVAAAGTARHVTFTGVTLKEEGTGAMTTLAADVTCP
jgi:hypothetical protein